MDTPPPEIQIEIDEPTAKGLYTNLALISHSETEFVLDFTFLQPQPRKAKVHTRIITSPVHAKRFLWALQDNLRKFETRFGEIQAGRPPQEGSKPVDFYQ
ncbi:MAG: hypothetical protein A2X36_15695 [Elusimicrobia bacterium GWA2_69_24]|nr:MAG: hypothetical protein A2X36_15695 [Elusimicrobia bacterium GWA2_69_24]HBL18796.1 DUF3467 domain-containing protein [Elusimicrobiota bacterium]